MNGYLMLSANFIILVLQVLLLRFELIYLSCPFIVTCLYSFDLFLKVLLLFLAELFDFRHLLLHFELSQLLITRTLGVSCPSHSIPMIKLAHDSIHLLFMH